MVFGYITEPSSVSMVCNLDESCLSSLSTRPEVIHLMQELLTTQSCHSKYRNIY